MQEQSPQSLVHPPECPDCRKPMRYAASELDKTNAQIRRVIFVCSCGRTGNQVVAAI
jgi:hypothetical protein